MRLDHVTIVASDCAPLRRFFVDIAGMEDGARPAFSVGGHWLYLDRRPVLHLIERTDMRVDAGISVGRPPARIDHMALRLDSATEWQALLQRLHQSHVPYQLSDIDALEEQQLFVRLTPEVMVEFVIAARHFARTVSSSSSLNCP